jgi:uncharacterized protein
MEGRESVEKCFVVDSMLGKVAKWLRILGYDTRYEPISDPKIMEYANAGWIVLTRRRRWCALETVVCLYQNEPLDQIRELHSKVQLQVNADKLLSRCIRCNEPLQNVDRSEVYGQVPDYVFETVSRFRQCSRCRKLYWQGSHPERMVRRLRHELGCLPPGKAPDHEEMQ